MIVTRGIGATTSPNHGSISAFGFTRKLDLYERVFVFAYVAPAAFVSTYEKSSAIVGANVCGLNYVDAFVKNSLTLNVSNKLPIDINLNNKNGVSISDKMWSGAFASTIISAGAKLYEYAQSSVAISTERESISTVSVEHKEIVKIEAKTPYRKSEI
jgi:hypothetical protein